MGLHGSLSAKEWMTPATYLQSMLEHPRNEGKIRAVTLEHLWNWLIFLPGLQEIMDMEEDLYGVDVDWNSDGGRSVPAKFHSQKGRR